MRETEPAGDAGWKKWDKWIAIANNEDGYDVPSIVAPRRRGSPQNFGQVPILRPTGLTVGSKGNKIQRDCRS